MTKHTRPNINSAAKPLSFVDFWTYISEQLGDHRLDINKNASNIKEFFNPYCVHPEHLKTLIIDTLPCNTSVTKTTRLNQSIDLNALLDALGEAAFCLRENSADDLFDIELLEEIAWHINERFKEHIELPNEIIHTNSTDNTVAKLINFRKRY